MYWTSVKEVLVTVVVNGVKKFKQKPRPKVKVETKEDDEDKDG